MRHVKLGLSVMFTSAEVGHVLPFYSINIFRVEDRLMNYLLAGELFTKINHKPGDLHYKFNIFSLFFVPLFPVTCNIIYL